MVVCPRCQSMDVELVKSWDVKPKSGRGRAIRVSIYLCKTCNHKFRKAAKLEEAVSHVSKPSVAVEAPAVAPVIHANVTPSDPPAAPVNLEPERLSFIDRLKRSFGLM